MMRPSVATTRTACDPRIVAKFGQVRNVSGRKTPKIAMTTAQAMISPYRSSRSTRFWRLAFLLACSTVEGDDPEAALTARSPPARYPRPCNYPHLSKPNQGLAGFAQIVSLCAELFEGPPRQATLSGSNIDRSRNYNGPCGWSEMWVIARSAPL